MKFGERLKQLRQQLSLTQPELAERACLEQSYLSKLENDKSCPSADSFNALLSALNVSAQDFINDMSPAAIERQLKDVPEVKKLIAESAQKELRNRRVWLYSAAVSSVFGLTLIVLGVLAMMPKHSYYYESPGIVKPGESKQIFDDWRWALSQERDGLVSEEEVAAWRQRMQDKKLEMRDRQNIEFLVSGTYLGEKFNRSVTEGSRTFELRKTNLASSSPSPILVVGVFLLLAGIFAYITDARLSRTR